MTIGRALVALILLLLFSYVPSADAEPTGAAKQHFDRGIAAFRARHYAEAAEAMRQSYQAQPEAETLFAWAQAARLAGDCKTAVGLYRQFLEMRPTGMQADAARIPLARCEEQLGPGVPAAPTPPAQPAAPPPATAPSVPQPRDEAPAGTPWYLDPLGDGLAAGGLVGLGVGIGFLAAGSSAASDAAGAATYDEALDRRNAARSRRIVGAVSLVVGVGLVGAATWRWVTVGRRERTLGVAPAPGGGATVWLGGTF